MTHTMQLQEILELSEAPTITHEGKIIVDVSYSPGFKHFLLEDGTTITFHRKRKPLEK